MIGFIVGIILGEIVGAGIICMIVMGKDDKKK